MSVKREFERILAEVEAVGSDDTQLPPLVLKVAVLLEQAKKQGSLAQFRSDLWDSGLVYVIIDSLQIDLEDVEGEWDTFGKIALLLGECSAGCPSEELAILQIPSTLFTMLLHLKQDYLEQRLPSLLANFQKILDALLLLCRAHPVSMIPDTLDNPILTHLAKGKQGQALIAILRFLRAIFSIECPLFTRKAFETKYATWLYHLFCELCNTLTQSVDIELIGEAVLLFHYLAKKFPFSRDGEAFLSDVQGAKDQWKNQYFSPYLTELCDMLLESEVLEGSTRLPASSNRIHHLVELENRAASVLQAHWRGKAARKRLRQMNEAFRGLQLIFRAKRLKKQLQEEHLQVAREKGLREMEKRHQARLTYVQRYIDKIKSLPAKEVDMFIFNLQNDAATTIQRRWRGVLGRQQARKIKHLVHAARAAVMIQKYVRGFLVRQRRLLLDASVRYVKSYSIPGLTDSRRTELQEEILKYRETHFLPGRARDEVHKAHEVTKEALLRHVTLSRTQISTRLKTMEDALAHLKMQSDAFLGVSRLDELPHIALPLPSPQYGSSSSLSSQSHAMYLEAKASHQATIKNREQPWWEILAEKNKTEIPVSALLQPPKLLSFSNANLIH